MKTIFKKYVVKTWDELTEEEKAKEIERNCETISTEWNNLRYEDFKNELEDIKDRYKNIKFDDVYIDDSYNKGYCNWKYAYKYIVMINEIVEG